MLLRRVAAAAFTCLVGCVKTPPPSAPTLAVPVTDVAPSAHAHVTPFERRFAQGDRVEVLWNGRWWPAIVLETRTGRWLVHYEGYADEWDETVEVDRIRERDRTTSSTSDDDDPLPDDDP